jgi:hypothetical protein
MKAWVLIEEWNTAWATQRELIVGVFSVEHRARAECLQMSKREKRYERATYLVKELEVIE